MATVFDVAEYILRKRGSVSAMKLQKLVYYSQAWHLVWSEEPLFDERIEAWASGPVVRELFDKHRGRFRLAPGDIGGNSASLTPDQKDSIDRVLEFYGDKTPQWLSDLTHMEAPWQHARAGLAEGERSGREITLETMAEYYGSL